jgi:hypothetical protein
MTRRVPAAVARALSALVVAVLVLSALSLAATTEVRAADPAFCRQYSQAALKQVRGGLASQRCGAGLEGSRWSSDFSVHYQWCLGVTYADAGTERDARTTYLRGCR